ncbi:MAG: alpha/beta hydrolase family protein [Haloglomus sp.]
MTDTERHTVPVTEGESVVAVHHPRPGSDRWFVCCHGFVSDKSGSYEGRCARAVAEGYHAVRFDFRGCGESDGDFVDTTLSSRIADLRAVLEHFDPESVVLFGSSFGGKTALHAAVGDGPGSDSGGDGAGSHNDSGGDSPSSDSGGDSPSSDGTRDGRLLAVAARAPVTYGRAFESLREAVHERGRVEYAPGYPVDERFVDDFAGYDFADVTARLDVPVAVFHGRDDSSVPLQDSLDAVGALSTDAALWAVADEGHRFSRAAEDRMRDALFDWLARLD